MVRALVYIAAQNVALHQVEAARITQECQLRVKAQFSAISRGTERLVFEGGIPESELQRMRAPFQVGEFPFPVRYGYSMVGIVKEGSEELRGKQIFALFPHQDEFVIPETAAIPLPEGVPARRATLAANMETALNAVWDSGAGPGDRIAIVGGGVVGGLLAGLCGAIPGCDVTLVDVNFGRAKLATHMNVSFCHPADAQGGADVVFHTSATEAGLQTALSMAGIEGRIVELSWYGASNPSVPLGGAFHSQRLQLISSQVGQIAPTRRARWDYRRRLAKALQLLRDPRYDKLITGEVAFGDLAAELPSILAPGAPGLATLVRYG